MLHNFIPSMLDSLNLGVDAWHAFELPSIGNDHLLRFLLGGCIILHGVLLECGLLSDRIV